MKNSIPNQIRKYFSDLGRKSVQSRFDGFTDEERKKWGLKMAENREIKRKNLEKDCPEARGIISTTTCGDKRRTRSMFVHVCIKNTAHGKGRSPQTSVKHECACGYSWYDRHNISGQ